MEKLVYNFDPENAPYTSEIIYGSGSFAVHIGDHIWFGIICIPHRESYVVRDHLHSNRGSFTVWGSFAALCICNGQKVLQDGGSVFLHQVGNTK